MNMGTHDMVGIFGAGFTKVLSGEVYLDRPKFKVLGKQVQTFFTGITLVSNGVRVNGGP